MPCDGRVNKQTPRGCDWSICGHMTLIVMCSKYGKYPLENHSLDVRANALEWMNGLLRQCGTGDL